MIRGFDVRAKEIRIIAPGSTVNSVISKVMNDVTPFGLTLLVDKPLSWTSFDVVNKLRYHCKKLTGKKKIKVGHAGTLDPLATGLVIVCIGPHTKRVDQLMGMEKEYEGTMVIGATTPSYDLETEIDQRYNIPEFNETTLRRASQSFLGETDQIPPIFSAKKVEGQKAYLAARKGKEVEMRANRINIHQFDIVTNRYPEIDFRLTCSKGTYVRSLVFDFGRKLGSGAYLSRLNRTRIGDFSLDNAYAMEEAIEHIEQEYFKYLRAVAN